jgi:TolB-like protein
VELDTDGTVAAWKSARDNVIKPLVDKKSGHIIKFTGDGFLVEFPSVQDAVACAITLQEELRSSSLNFRMGINVGDITDDGGDVHGEGVNIAARLEALAEPGGICISGDVYNQVRNRIDASFKDMGEQEVKHVSQPVSVFAINPTNQKTSDHLTSQTPALPDKPSIAVLPFDNMSGDPEQEYFADGITEDIITALSRMPWFFVIARNSSFVYKNRAVDIKEIAIELSVQYVLEGSVRKSGERVRITAQLIDALSGKHVWADRYDRELADVFAVQDEVVESIVGEVAPEFLSAEARRARQISPENLNAWDLVMQGRWHMWKLGRIDLSQARELFKQAIDIVPSGEFGASDLALTHMFEAYYNWTESRDESMQAMSAFAEQAVAADDHDAWAHTILGLGRLFACEWDEILPPLDHAISLYPNFAPALGIKGMAMACLDEADEAIACYEKAVRLSPHDSLKPLWLIGRYWASWSAQKYSDAVTIAKELVRLAPDNPTGRRQLAAAYVATDQLDKAESALQSYLQLEPEHTVADIRVPSKNPEPLQRFAEALRRAGLPG